MEKNSKKPPFDPSRFAMPSTGAEEFGTRKIRSVIPVNKPGKMEWVYVLDDEDFLIPGAALLDLKDGGRMYLVVPEIAAQLDDDVRLYTLAPAVTKQDKLFLWPCPIIRPGETPIPWHVTHIAAFDSAKTGWIRMKSNRACGFYDILEPKSAMPEPEWPEMSFSDMLKVAFNDDHIVDRDDHPALRRLLGEM
ncbi:hypothetical protein OAS27_04600 [Alphaproteobacteria bacterium]|nr:hypothetical protein [Alphaproteobacteria bacterium]